MKTKKGCLQTDLLSSSSRAPQTGGILMMCFISKSSCYPTKEKPRVCTGLTCCSLGGTISLACARIARWIDWPRSQCPALPCLHVETPSLGKCCTVLCMYCTVVVVPYCTYLAKLVALGHILENPFARFLIGPFQVEGGVSQAPGPSIVFFFFFFPSLSLSLSDEG